MNEHMQKEGQGMNMIFQGMQMLASSSSLYIPFFIPPQSMATVYTAFNGTTRKIVQVRETGSMRIIKEYCSCDYSRQPPECIINPDPCAYKFYMVLVSLENINCDATQPAAFRSLRGVGSPEGGQSGDDKYLYRTHLFTTLDEADTVFITIIVQVGVDTK